LAILLHHPLLLAEVEEPLAGLELPEGQPALLQQALLDWLARGDLLDSTVLIDHLHGAGLAEAVAWAIRPDGLPKEARAEAQPKEALDGWWHFFGFLRGEAALAEDLAAARRALVETNDPLAQQRLIRLSEALVALRCGEADDGAMA
jgi:DNA primase